MKITLLALLFLCFNGATLTKVNAKDFGIDGTVYPIVEPDFLEQVQSNLKKAEQNGQIKALQNQMKNNQSMLSSNSLLSPTSKNNYYNYSTRNPQKQNFNQTEFNINPNENLNNFSQMYNKTLNSPLYNFPNRV